MNVSDFLATPQKARAKQTFLQTTQEFPFTYTYYGFGASSNDETASIPDSHFERENNNDDA